MQLSTRKRRPLSTLISANSGFTNVMIMLSNGTPTKLTFCLRFHLPTKDSQLSQFAPSILAMSSMAVAIDGLSADRRHSWRLTNIVCQIHEATNKVNELELMIDVASKIEKYVQMLQSCNSTYND